MIFEHSLRTPREGYVDITAEVRSDLSESGVQSGIAVVFAPHTTAAVTINENADPDVVSDMKIAYCRAFPDSGDFAHNEGNSAAHCKSSAIGPSLTVIIESGRLVLGTWQGIYFCEFDGPRSRRYIVKIMEG